MTQTTSTEIKRALADKHSRDFFLTECKSGSTWMTQKGEMKILDALAIRKSWTEPCFTGYEVKVSRGDFLRDAKFYTYEELCNRLYIVCPKGMIERTELPESVGLIYYNPDTKSFTTKKKAIFREITYSPEMLLYIIYSKLDSDRIPFYSSKREYFEAYLAEKKWRHVLGERVGSKLLNEVCELRQQIEDIGKFRDSCESYKKIIEVCRKHHISVWSSERIASELDKALTKKLPDGIEDLRSMLERAVECIKRMEQEDLP